MKIISLKNIFSRTTGQFLLIGLLSLSACKDEPVRLTGNVLPEGEVLQGLNYNEHVLATINTTRDAIQTSQATSGVLGTFNDPVFGKSEGSFVTDFSIGAKVQPSVDVLFYKIDSDSTRILEDVELNNKFDNNNITIETPTDWYDHEKWKPYSEVWTVDSLVLSLQYQFNDWYGDMLDKQKISVYELTEGLGSSSTKYYHNSPIPGHNTTPIASKLVHPNDDVPDSLKSEWWSTNLWKYPDSLLNRPEYLWDQFKVSNDIDSGWLDTGFTGHTTTTKYWNFKLNDEITDRFFNLSEDELLNTSAFKGVFNGLYIDSDDNSTEEGALTKINLPTYSSSNYGTRLTLYYTRNYKYINDAEEVRDTSKQFPYIFPINVENVRFNKYKHPDINDIVTDEPEPETLYLQGMAGSYTQMEFPDEIINWVDSLENTDPYISVSNIEFFMEIDTMSLVSDDYDHPIDSDPDKVRAIQRYPIPQNLSIVWQDDKGEFVTPTYSIIVGGQKFTTPLFGSNADQNGNRSGTGELLPRHIYDDDNNYLRTEYLYYFIMRADFFNYVMRNEDGASLNEKQFFIGPSDNSTANFKRVTLFGGANKEKPMEMNIKYFHYIPR
ncbi:DUF4270 family protein [Carboxylicivirga sp. N1Y90]|uniref:DUF4270 family protein n=1 Tax=Carboxylicivirga fragile TaxID=3417571 RepID=UPI003D3436B5|nr:DUF4270 family protein [Marinilabiliaceae bacterium N1Y90]